MYKSSLVEKSQSIQQLLGKNPDKSCAQSSKLVLLDKLIKIYAKELKHKTEMLSMNKGVFQSKEMMVVIFVKLSIELECVSTDIWMIMIEKCTRSSTDTSIILWLK